MLLRDATFVLDHAVDIVRLEASRKHGMKAGIVVHSRRVGAPSSEPPFAIASLHLKWCPHDGDPSAKLALLADATAAIAAGATCILGGDFNTEVADLPAHGITDLLRTFRLNRVPSSPEEPTGMTSELTWSRRHVIDHIFVSESLCCSRPTPTMLDATMQPAAPVQVGPLPRKGHLGPWGNESGHSGSDHAWLLTIVHVQ